jgi:hypothetical protein
MGLGTKKEGLAEKQERILDPGNSNDKRVIQEFERELKPYIGRSKTLFRGTPYQVTLSGFWLYLHEKNLFRYSESHKNGAVVSENLEYYREALRKYNGMGKLIDRRSHMERQEAERSASI